MSTNARIAIWVAVVCVALGFLWLVRGVLPPFILAIVVAMVLEPVVRKLGEFHVPRPAAVLSITAAFFGLVATAIILVTPRVADQINDARVNVQSLVGQWTQDEANDNVFVRWNPIVRAQPPGPLAVVDKTFEQFRPLLNQFGLPPSRRAIFDEYVTPHRNEIAKSAETYLNNFIGSLGGALASVFPLFFTPIFVIFILMDLDNIAAKAQNWIPPSLRSGVVGVSHDIVSVFQRYLQGMMVNVFLYAIVMSAVLTAVGAPYAILLALMAAALYVIPILGGWISGITILTVTALSGTTGAAWFHLGSPFAHALLVFFSFIIVSATWDVIITPKVVGSAVDLHPLVAMFVVFCGGGLFGLLGMIIAYPLAGIAKVTLARIMAVANDPNSTELELPAVPPRHRTAPA